MRYLSVETVERIHDRLLAQSGGTTGIRDRGALLSAVAQPEMGVGDDEFYPTLAAKAAALCYSLVRNHPFIDGNKRIGFAAADVFLRRNGMKLVAPVDEAERIVLALASGEVSREALQAWMEGYLKPRVDV